MNDVLLPSGAISEDLNLGELSVVSSTAYRTGNFGYNPRMASISTISSAWDTPSFWEIVSTTNNPGVRADIGLYRANLADANRDAFLRQTDAIVLGLLEQMVSRGAYMVSFTLVDVSASACARFLSSVVFGTVQSNLPNYVNIEFTSIVQSGFSVDRFASVCRERGADGVQSIRLYWGDMTF